MRVAGEVFLALLSAWLIPVGCYACWKLVEMTRRPR